MVPLLCPLQLLNPLTDTSGSITNTGSLTDWMLLHLSQYAQDGELWGAVLVPGRGWLIKAIKIPRTRLWGKVKPEVIASSHLCLTPPDIASHQTLVSARQKMALFYSSIALRSSGNITCLMFISILSTGVAPPSHQDAFVRVQVSHSWSKRSEAGLKAELYSLAWIFQFSFPSNSGRLQC